MGFGVHTALLAFRQLSSVTEGFKPCWRTGQSAHLETILFSFEHLNICIYICLELTVQIVLFSILLYEFCPVPVVIDNVS